MTFANLILVLIALGVASLFIMRAVIPPLGAFAMAAGFPVIPLLPPQPHKNPGPSVRAG
ncbi:hypothetical protein CLV41_1011028 [Roseibium marinum]|uniref:Uncharacterized protein n=1 Tax=Roseibium marinum TaxID=281252 RepID=A0A2S3V3K8_9HYPH|nr:hypothetical protein CLV41_1011028 [Roseibium marinum]